MGDSEWALVGISRERYVRRREKRREIDEDGERRTIAKYARDDTGKKKLNQSERNASWLDRDTEVTIYSQRSRRVIKIFVYTEYISRT